MFRKFVAALSTPAPATTELFSGVPKPSWALAGMVAAHIIQHADKVEAYLPLKLRKDEACHSLTDRTRFASFSDDKMKVEVRVQFKNKGGSSYNYVEDLSQRQCSVNFGKYVYSFDQKEKNLIVEAMIKASGLVRERAAEKAATERQQKACDLIEQLFGPPVEEAKV